MRKDDVDRLIELRKALAEEALDRHEPVAWMLHGELFWPSEYEVISEAGDNAIPLYTALPQKEWKGLTDEDYNIKQVGEFDVVKFAKYIEAKLKEKNQ